MQSRAQHRACAVVVDKSGRTWQSHKNGGNFQPGFAHEKPFRKTHHQTQKENRQENIYTNTNGYGNIGFYANSFSTKQAKEIHFDYSKMNLKANLAPKNPPNISNHYKYNQRSKEYSQPLPRNIPNKRYEYFQDELQDSYQVHSDQQYIHSSMETSLLKQAVVQAKVRFQSKKLNPNVRFGIKQPNSNAIVNVNANDQKQYRLSKDLKNFKCLKQKQKEIKTGFKKLVRTKQFTKKPENPLKIKTSNLIAQPKLQKKLNIQQKNQFPINDKIKSHNSPNERYKESVESYNDLLSDDKVKRKSVQRVRQVSKLMKSSKGSSKMRKQSRNAYTELNKSSHSQFTSVDEKREIREIREINNSSIKKQPLKKTKNTKSNNNLFQVQRRKAEEKRFNQLRQKDLFSKNKIKQKITRIQQQTSFEVIQEQEAVFLCDEQMQPLKQARNENQHNHEHVYRYNSNPGSHLTHKQSLINFCCEVPSIDQKNTERLKTATGAPSSICSGSSYSKASLEIPLKKSEHIIMSPQEEIRQFEQKIEQINSRFEVESFKFARQQELNYLKQKLDAGYLQKKQKNLTWIKRSVLISWMIEALQEQGNQRETLARSVALLDLFLSSPKSSNIELKDFQLFGAVCMLISAKLQQNTISVDFVYGTFKGMYDIEDIQKCEQRILKTLQWKLNPPTANMWANRLGKQWDSYLQTYPEKVSGCMILSQKLVKFKEQSEQYYLNYRCLIQYIDFALLDIQTLQYQPCVLAASFIYIVLLKKLNLYSDSQIVQEFPKSSNFLQPAHLVRRNFNDFFNQFLNFTFDIEILELLPTIQYASTFLILPLVNNVPQLVQKSDKQFSYEELCSFQTKNQFAKEKLKLRNRSLINF